MRILDQPGRPVRTRRGEESNTTPRPPPLAKRGEGSRPRRGWPVRTQASRRSGVQLPPAAAAGAIAKPVVAQRQEPGPPPAQPTAPASTRSEASHESERPKDALM